jgi:hypothetical protein
MICAHLLVEKLAGLDAAAVAVVAVLEWLRRDSWGHTRTRPAREHRANVVLGTKRDIADITFSLRMRLLPLSLRAVIVGLHSS